MLKVQYESFVDWRLHRDVLRCSPQVYSKERRDCVLVRTNQGVTLARLLMLLKCTESQGGKQLQIALVLFFDPVYRSISALERATGLRRFRQRPRDKAALVSVASIVRGALIVPLRDQSHKDDFLANDLVDADMYLRFLYYTRENQFE